MLIPVNTFYRVAGTNLRLEGDGINHFPAESKPCDEFTTEDYKYKCSIDNNGVPCWDVRVKSTSHEEYQPLLSEINGLPLRLMTATFKDCGRMKTAPAIPPTVENMTLTFKRCSALVEPPEIPEGVTHLPETFMECNLLEIAPIIPASVVVMSNTFYGCISLRGRLVCNASDKALEDEAFISMTLYKTKLKGVEGDCSQEVKDRLWVTK